MSNTDTTLLQQATIVAMALESLRALGLSVDEIKGLFLPNIIDGWFAISANGRPGVDYAGAGQALLANSSLGELASLE